jgi:hypothetical protein
MGLYRDDNGAFIPFGRVRRELVANFLDGQLPGAGGASWLSCPSGTPTVVGVGADPGYLQVATGATIGNQAVLAGPALEARLFRGIAFTLEGLMFDNVTTGKTRPSIELSGSWMGASFVQGESASSAVLRSITASVNTDTTVPFYNLRANISRKNLTLLMLPRQYGELAVLSDDQEIAYVAPGATWGNAVGNLTPRIVFETREAVAHNFRVQQVKLTLWSN